MIGLTKQRRVQERRLREAEREVDFERARREQLAGIYEDETSWLAETLNGEMRSSYRFELLEGELYAREKAIDGGETLRHLKTMYLEGAECAKIRAASDPRVSFEIERERHHLEELTLMEEMAAGRAPNTAIIISPFPEELSGEQEDDIQGYKPKLRRSMVRLITFSSSGDVTVTSQSLDHTDRATIEAVFTSWDMELPSHASTNDILSRRITRNMPPGWQKTALDNIKRTWDESLAQRFGGDWQAGRRQSQGNTWEFVLQQEDLLRDHLDQIADLIGLARSGDSWSIDALADARYKTAAAMKRRYDGNVRDSYGGDTTSEREAAGAAAQASGQTFGGCGLTVEASISTAATAESQLAQLGYRARVEFKPGDCRVCLKSTKVGECSVCMECEIADNTGGTEALDRIYKKAIEKERRGRQSPELKIEAVKPQKAEPGSERKIGSFTIKHQIVIGGTKQIVTDSSGTALSDEAAASILQHIA